MSLQNITMPRLGESVVEATMQKWLVKVGDKVKKYQPLAEVESDKASAEIPSSYEGIIKEIIAKEGQVVPVDGIVCIIETSGSGDSTAPTSEKKSESSQASQNTPTAQKSNSEYVKNNRYSPVVKQLASEHNINLDDVEGSGESNRVTRKDIMQIIESGNIPKKSNVSSPQPIQSASSKPSEAPKPSPMSLATGDVSVPVTAIRKAIANKMVKSVTEIPHAWLMIEIDATNLVNFRDKMKDKFKKAEGYNLTFLPFFVKAVVEGLKEFPELNSVWADENIIMKKNINISLAMATKENLFVPVIKNADEKSIKGIAREISELAEKTKSKKLTAEDMQGGTFTVNNTGAFGSIMSMGIINHPQAAILQVESIVKRPVFMHGGFVPRDIVNVCLSIDHRVLDGLISGSFLKKVKTYIESIDDSFNIY